MDNQQHTKLMTLAIASENEKADRLSQTQLMTSKTELCKSMYSSDYEEPNKTYENQDQDYVHPDNLSITALTDQQLLEERTKVTTDITVLQKQLNIRQIWLRMLNEELERRILNPR